MSAQSYKGIAYRVERVDGHPVGWDVTESGAIGVADETNIHAPDDGPYVVREVPEDEVHDMGLGVYDIVYTTDGGSE
jgi:hypothetical protein